MLEEIKSPRIRNLVRGILSAGTEKAKEETFRHFRRETSLADARAVYGFLEGPLAFGFKKTEPFPVYPHRMQDFTFFDPSPISHELVAQGVRIERNIGKLIDAMHAVKEINDLYFLRDYKELSRRIDTVREEFGFSLFFLRKILFFKHCGIRDQDIDAAANQFTTAYQTPRRDIIAIAMEDVFDLSTPYPRIRKIFMDFAQGPRVDGATRARPL